MPKDKDKNKKVSTILEMNKKCKSSARFGSPDNDESVTTALYLLNDSHNKLGKPTKIKVSVSAVE